MQEKWRRSKECLDKPDLFSEDYAVHEALTHFEELDYQGGAINQPFCSKAWAHMEYVNREQDPGLEALMSSCENMGTIMYIQMGELR